MKREKRLKFSYSSYILGIDLNYIVKFAALSALLVIVRYQLEPKSTKEKFSKSWRGGKSSLI